MIVAVYGSWVDRGDSIRSKNWQSTGNEADFQELCGEIGRVLAVLGHGIVVTSNKESTADPHVMQGFVDQWQKCREPKPEGQRCYLILADPSEKKQDKRLQLEEMNEEFRLREARTPQLFTCIHQHHSNRFGRHLAGISIADAGITIAGANHTRDAARQITQENKVLLPIGSFGGASQRVLRAMLETRPDLRVLEDVSLADVEVLLKEKLHQRKSHIDNLSADAECLLRWLHISDLHFHTKSGARYHEDIVQEELLKEIRRCQKDTEWRPDMIFVTGDIAHSGKKAEYENATTFFDKLLSEAGLHRDRLFVVPGNHDIDRDRRRGLTRKMESQREADDYFCTGNLLHFHKLQAYQNWHREYFGTVPSFDSTCTSQIVRLPIRRRSGNGEIRIGILSINTALFSVDDHDHNELWIGRGLLRSALPEIEDCDLRIAIMHHPLHWLHGEEEDEITHLLRTKMNIIMNGHTHRQRPELVSSSHGSSLHITAGSACQRSGHPHLIVYGRLVSFASQDPLKRTVELRSMRYNEEKAIWAVDTVLHDKDEGFIGRYELPKNIGR